MASTIDWPALRESLREVLERTCPNRAEFARRMGVHRNTVDRVLDGEREPSLDTLVAWLRAGRVQPSVWFSRFDEPVTLAVTPAGDAGAHGPITSDDAALLLRFGAILTAAAQLALAGPAPDPSPARPPAPRGGHGDHR